MGGGGGGVESTSQCSTKGTIIINLYYTVRRGGCGGRRFDVQSMDEQKLSRWIPSVLSHMQRLAFCCPIYGDYNVEHKHMHG